MIAYRHTPGALDAYLATRPPLIFRDIDGRLEPWEPRAHPEPWTEHRTRRERRWWARHKKRGRRSAVRSTARIERPADRLKDAYPIWDPQPFYGAFDPDAVYDSVVTRSLLRRKDYECAVKATPCPYFCRGPSCGMTCMMYRRHVQRVTITVYSADHGRLEREVARVLREEAGRVHRRLMADVDRSR